MPSYFSLLTIAEYELWWFLNFDGLKFLTALVLYSQSDYLNHLWSSKLKFRPIDDL